MNRISYKTIIKNKTLNEFEEADKSGVKAVKCEREVDKKE